MSIHVSNASAVRGLTGPPVLPVECVSQNCEKRLLASSCLSVCTHGTTLAPTGRIFKKFDSYFSKIVEKIQVSLKSDKNDGYCTRRPLYMYDHISLNST